MNAGDLDRRIRIERAMMITDEFGEKVPTWGLHASVWASVKPISDGERWRAQEVAAHVTTRFTIRWGFDVKATDRIQYNGLVYEIVGPPKELGRQEGQEITAAARAD